MKRQLEGMTVAILVADGFEQAELTEPKQALEDAGAETRIVSPADEQVEGWKHFDSGDSFAVDVALDDADAQDFDACCFRVGWPIPINCGCSRKPWSS